MKYRTASGFTLIELMLTILVAAVLAGVAVPNLRDFMRNNRLSAAADELVRSLQTARSEAVKRQGNVVVCMSANPTNTAATCSTSGFSGWIVFVDTNNDWARDTSSATEILIEAHTFESDKMKLLGDQSLRTSFAASGFVNASNSGSTMQPSTRFALCDERGNKTVGTQSTARGIRLSAGSGRPTSTRNKTDIATFSTQISSFNTECPG